MRWLAPISSCREYPDISQNLLLTKVMVPFTSVMATMAALSRA
jgi:hypothetical protein